MKNKFLTLATATLFLIGASFFTSCGNTETTEETEDVENIEDETEQVENMDENDETEQIAAFVCPMHPEETGVEGDKCSKCEMPLEKAKDEAEKMETEEEDHTGHNHD